MILRPDHDIDALVDDDALFDRAVARAHADVVRRHRLFGLPLVIWRDGQVVEVSAEEVPIPTPE